MAWLKRHSTDDDHEAPETSEDATVGPPLRSAGPWDVTERQTADDPSYVDLGALQIRGRAGMEIRLQSDGDTDRIGAALVLADESALELRVFAAPRSSGQWDLVRADIVEEVVRMEGDQTEIIGPFGPELHIQIPVTTEDGQAGFQPSRIIGVEGPRWMLRATLLGRSAISPSNDDPLIDVLRDVVVVRGEQAMMAREALLLTPPTTAVVAEADSDADAEPDATDAE